MSDSPQALFDEADACHDADPGRAAELLRRIDPAALPAERLPGLAFLLNHVLGEKLGAWARGACAVRSAAARRGREAAARCCGARRLPRRASPAMLPPRRACRCAGGCHRRKRSAGAGRGRAHADDVSRAAAACGARRQSSRVCRAAAFAGSAWQPAEPARWGRCCLRQQPRLRPDRTAGARVAAGCRCASAGRSAVARRALLATRRYLGQPRARRLPARDGGQRSGPRVAGTRARAARAGAARRERHRAAEQVDRAFIELEQSRACRTLGLCTTRRGRRRLGRRAGSAVQRRRARRVVRVAPRRTRRAAWTRRLSGAPAGPARHVARALQVRRARQSRRRRQRQRGADDQARQHARDLAREAQEVVMRAVVGAVGDHAQQRERQAEVGADLGHGRAFHLHRQRVGQGQPQRVALARPWRRSGRR